MQKFLTLAAIAALSLSTVAPVYAQDSVPAFDEVNKEDDDDKAALLIAGGVAAALLLLVSSGSSTSGT
ncbi:MULTISPECIES: hypothetical protein [Falsihalocynthiibacter]|uniref:hypothetical protein n=1 Tax=Falsihalocynthiibacter TaxID=2854182 RepID=UPI00300255C3